MNEIVAALVGLALIAVSVPFLVGVWPALPMAEPVLCVVVPLAGFALLTLALDRVAVRGAWHR